MANSQRNSTFSICVTPQAADLNQAAFEALAFVAVGNVGNIGEMGTTTNILNYDTMTDSVSDKAKGISNAGDPDIECARVVGDAGQVAMRAAAATNFVYAFKLERDDGTITNTIIFNRGLVVGPKRPNGRNEDFDLEVFTLGLVQLEVVVDAT